MTTKKSGKTGILQTVLPSENIIRKLKENQILNPIYMSLLSKAKDYTPEPKEEKPRFELDDLAELAIAYLKGEVTEEQAKIAFRGGAKGGITTLSARSYLLKGLVHAYKEGDLRL